MIEKVISKPVEILARGEDVSNVTTVGGYMSADTTNFPAGFFPRGLLVAETTVSGESGFFAPYLTLDASIHTAQANWDEQVVSGVSRALDTEDYVNGVSSVKITVASTVAATTVLASDVITDSDVTASTHMLFWIKCSVATAAGDLQMGVSETASLGGSPHFVNVPALEAGIWTLCCVASGTMTGLDHIVSAGIKYVTDLGACTIWVGDWRSMKVNTPAGIGVLKDNLYFNSKTNTLRNVNGVAGYEAKVMTHGEFVKANLVGYDTDFKTDVSGALTENSTVLTF